MGFLRYLVVFFVKHSALRPKQRPRVSTRSVPRVPARRARAAAAATNSRAARCPVHSKWWNALCALYIGCPCMWPARSVLANIVAGLLRRQSTQRRRGLGLSVSGCCRPGLQLLLRCSLGQLARLIKQTARGATIIFDWALRWLGLLRRRVKTSPPIRQLLHVKIQMVTSYNRRARGIAVDLSHRTVGWRRLGINRGLRRWGYRFGPRRRGALD
mmetsp:Transcript_97027/g.222324  ORF Transcript_97027/g.222324 Transcript_97027/m.222324 type:complete len:214 (+) Transcript_97027:456-1097(+)